MESRKLMASAACIIEVASANTMLDGRGYGCQVVCEIRAGRRPGRAVARGVMCGGGLCLLGELEEQLV